MSTKSNPLFQAAGCVGAVLLVLVFLGQGTEVDAQKKGPKVGRNEPFAKTPLKVTMRFEPMQ